MSDTKCIKCGQLVGNTVFTMCDNCWDKNPMTNPTPKQRLIEAVKEMKKDIIDSSETNSSDFEEHWDQGFIFACVKFNKLIEEILE